MIKAEILNQNGYDFLWISEENKEPECWMWNLPSEVEYQKEIARESYGDVLIAGYGLGLLQKELYNNSNVNNIVTIEKYKEVIYECRGNYGETYGDIIIDDYMNIKNNSSIMDKKFDCIIGDIWPEIDILFISHYQKFKEISLNFLKPGGQIKAWGKDYFEYIMVKNEKE